MEDLIKKIRAVEPTKEQLKDRTPEYAFGWVDSLNAATEVVKNNVGLHNVSVSLFDEALKTLRDLAEHQNGVPLIRHEEEYNKTMTEVWGFLEANET